MVALPWMNVSLRRVDRQKNTDRHDGSVSRILASTYLRPPFPIVIFVCVSPSHCFGLWLFILYVHPFVFVLRNEVVGSMNLYIIVVVRTCWKTP